MNAILDFFNLVAFTAFGVPVTVIEVLGFVTGAACVYGVSIQANWNWAVGILNNAAFALLFVNAKLYAETALQVIFAVIAVYGWWNWVHGGAVRNELPVRHASRREVVSLAVAGAAGTVAVAMLLTHGTDSEVPWPDAFVLAASLVATYGQAKKIVSSWYAWILVDLVSTPLYLSRGLYLTAILYVGFTVLCVYGLRNWRRALREQATAGAPVPPAPQAEAVAA